MADREGRGGGGFGWFFVGLVIGAVGTYATERFVHMRRHLQAEAAPSDSIPAVLAVSAAKPKLVVHQGGSSAPAAPVAAQSPDDVADDAAAAGMTSRRSPPSSAQPPN